MDSSYLSAAAAENALYPAAVVAMMMMMVLLLLVQLVLALMYVLQRLAGCQALRQEGERSRLFARRSALDPCQLERCLLPRHRPGCGFAAE